MPVSLTVPAYEQAVNAGGQDYTDQAGEVWAADRPYAPGGWGYTSARSRGVSTSQAIDGTDDDPLFQSQRVAPGEYRFDGLPAGTYQIDLRFAELETRKNDRRIFTISIEGRLVLPAHDIVSEVGPLAADSHSFAVEVVDGQLNIRLAPYGRGYRPPIVNALRVIHRPDR